MFSLFKRKSSSKTCVLAFAHLSFIFAFTLYKYIYSGNVIGKCVFIFRIKYNAFVLQHNFYATRNISFLIYFPPGFLSSSRPHLAIRIYCFLMHSHYFQRNINIYFITSGVMFGGFIKKENTQTNLKEGK